MAWRNIWRNRRRTIITVSAIALAVLWSSVLSSVQRGTWDHIIDNVSKFYLGYGQIHTKGFWGEQSLDLSMDPSEILSLSDSILPTDVHLIPRLESFALASYGLQTKGVLVLGYDPEQENQLTKLESRIINGTYANAGTEGVLIGDQLADNLKIILEDSLVLVGQGYHGQNAVGKYIVKGILHMRNPDLNKQMVAMPLPIAQALYGTGNLITAFAIQVPSRPRLPQIMNMLKQKLDTAKFEIMDYNELIPELVDAAKFDTASSKIILYVLYMLISFGLFGTIVMMTKERNYEFGVLTAIGTEKIKLASILWIESVLIAMGGAWVGIVLSLPMVNYLFHHPIPLSGVMAKSYERFGIEPVIYTAFNYRIFLEQAALIFIIAAMLGLYPVWKTIKLDSLKAMRS